MLVLLRIKMVIQLLNITGGNNGKYSKIMNYEKQKVKSFKYISLYFNNICIALY